MDRPKSRAQSTTPDGRGARDSLPTGESSGSKTRVQAATLVIAAVDATTQTTPTPNQHPTRTRQDAAETALSNTDGGAQYLGETWDGADPEEGASYRPLYYTQGGLDTAHNMRQAAADHMAQLLAAE